jgi:RecB family exonuclease
MLASGALGFSSQRQQAMALTIQLARSAGDLWAAFAARSLDEVASSGTTVHSSQIWLTHRNQRDRLLEEAARRGSRGWLNPPIHFLSSLPALFDIKGKPVGLLARRHLLASLAADESRRHGLPVAAADAAVVRGHMLDGFFGELLPEGVTPGALESSLGAVAGDDFARRRNAWIANVYAAYLDTLAQADRYDPRQIHALVARAIDNGNLHHALNGATRLHIFAFHSTRLRQCLLRAFANQNGVDVIVYATGDVKEWSKVGDRVETVGADAPRPFVQPAPDAHSELQWVAGQVKELLQSGSAEPHEVAVVARTGLEDTRRALRVLESAGIPASARVRTPLNEISALKAVLELFRAAAESWSYHSLRSVLASPYLGMRLDLRPFDRISGEARPASLAEWQSELEALAAATVPKGDPTEYTKTIQLEGMTALLARFKAFRAAFEPLDGSKPLNGWIDLLRGLLAERRFRLQLSRAQHDRYDVVRLDQRGVRQLELLLQEWSAVNPAAGELSPRAWYRLLRTLLEGQELVLTTPGQKGVQVLEAHDAASGVFKATFLIHANDGEFPRRSTNTGLFTEEEQSTLRSQGLPIDDREAVLQRERSLWQAVVGNAPRVSISYRTIDPTGTPLLRSPLIEAHDQRERELPRSVDEIGKPLNADQERRQAAARLSEALRAGERKRIVAADPAALQHALLVAHAEQLRGAPERRTVERGSNPWNGELRDPDVLLHLTSRFGADYSWSPSQLQEYATCPFFFLLDRVLDLREIEEADEETSALTFGGIAHDILERFYQAFKSEKKREAEVLEVPREYTAAAGQTLLLAADHVFAEREAAGEWLGSPVLWQQRKQNIVQVLAEYVSWELEHLSITNERPVFCEYVLGGADRYVVLSGYDVQDQAVEMRLAGRIDRIDVNAAGSHHVLDYKTSNIPATKGYSDGATLQAPVYLEALRQIGFTVGKGRYRALKSPGKPQNGAEVKLGDEKYRRALAIAFSVPERVRHGRFEVLLAASAEWQSYHPDASICRTRARLAAGSRFDV